MTRAYDKSDKRIIRMFFVERQNTAEIAWQIKLSEADVDRRLSQEISRRYHNERHLLRVSSESATPRVPDISYERSAWSEDINPFDPIDTPD